MDVERAQRGLLRITIDRIPGRVYRSGRASDAAIDPSEFVTVEDCEQVTRQLQYALEVEGLDYARLEVSSPGLDRPLKKAADYARFVGEQIEVTLKLPFQGRKKYRGVLEALGEGWRIVLVEPDVAVKGGKGSGKGSNKDDEPKSEQALDFSLEEVREARLVPVVDFKGRRFAPPPAVTEAAMPQGQTDESVELDGDRKQ